MKIRLCPDCKRPLADIGIAATLPAIKRRIYEVVAAAGEHGINRWDILDKAYADAPDGGPECVAAVKVHICQINKRIKAHGVKIAGTWRQGSRDNSLYRLVTIEETHS